MKITWHGKEREIETMSREELIAVVTCFAQDADRERKWAETLSDMNTVFCRIANSRMAR